MLIKVLFNIDCGYKSTIRQFSRFDYTQVEYLNNTNNNYTTTTLNTM